MTVTARNLLRLPVLLLMLAAAGCAVQRPGPDMAISDGALPPGHQHLVAQMAMGAHGEAYLVWMATGEKSEDWEFRFSRSEDGGATWSRPLWSRKPPQGMFAEMIGLATGPSGQVYLAWRERDHNKTDSRILMTRSLDGGRHWEETPRQLAVGDHLGVPHLQIGPDGVLYVAWLGGEEFHRVLEVVVSQDSGGTFASTPAQIQPVFSASKSERGITNPSVAADDAGRLYAVWEEGSKRGRDTGIYLSRSEDRGRTWSEPMLVSRPGTDSRGAYLPRIAAVSDGQVYLIWEQAERRTVTLEGRRRPHWPIDRSIYFTRSLDGGRTWLSEPIRLSRPDPMSPHPHKSFDTQVVCDRGGHVYVVFIEKEGEHTRRLLLHRSADSGATWAEPTELGRTSRVKGRIEEAVLAHDGGGRLWLVWQEHAFGPRYGWFVLMSRSVEHGQEWADNAVVIGEPIAGQATVRDLRLGVGGDGRILVAWDHGLRVNRPIVLRQSVDGGKSWASGRLPVD